MYWVFCHLLSNSLLISIVRFSSIQGRMDQSRRKAKFVYTGTTWWVLW
jgi:hypothetical protein